MMENLELVQTILLLVITIFTLTIAAAYVVVNLKKIKKLINPSETINQLKKDIEEANASKSQLKKWEVNDIAKIDKYIEATNKQIKKLQKKAGK